MLSTFKIINMYRELDKCTIYLVEKLKGVTDRKVVLMNFVFYRFFKGYVGIHPYGSTIYYAFPEK